MSPIRVDISKNQHSSHRNKLFFIVTLMRKSERWGPQVFAYYISFRFPLRLKLPRLPENALWPINSSFTLLWPTNYYLKTTAYLCPQRWKRDWFITYSFEGIGMASVSGPHFRHQIQFWMEFRSKLMWFHQWVGVGRIFRSFDTL